MPAAFTTDTIDRWLAALRRRPLTFTEAEWPEFPQAESLKVAGLAVGIAVRMRTRDDETIEFLMNPVAARELIRAVAEVGTTQGWLSEDGEITIPEVSLQS